MVECVYSLAGQVHNQGSSALRFVDRDEVITSAVAFGFVYLGQSERFRFLAMPLQNAPRLMRRYYHFAALVLYLEFFDVSILKSQALYCTVTRSFRACQRQRLQRQADASEAQVTRLRPENGRASRASVLQHEQR
mmetsp:Transcript_35159/g.80314  ORF Transcript_35159/g.80314 Transcript_35159/m.80314 type:complete len:135 (-) Transcript_35159:232-636(-)